MASPRVAILVENGFEQEELESPRDALKEAGGETEIVSPQAEFVRGWQHIEWGDEFPVDVELEKADPRHYDALLLPGGVLNPDSLRRNEKALEFVRHFFKENKPVFAICHGPWTLIDAGVAKGRRLTSYHTIQTDLKNAGCEWVDEPVVEDGNLITSRRPSDLEKFNQRIITALSAVAHA